MIVSSTADSFILIEQDHHANLAAEIMKKMDSHFTPKDKRWCAVLFAIAQHDCGWHSFDIQPFFNDEKKMPYSFLDFPTAAKAVLYRHGIDEVARSDVYAALLCSMHYLRFMEDDAQKEAQAFAENERLRQQEIKASIPDFDQETCNLHYAMLQFADNLSLYICLNAPGAKKENEHPFFKDGLSIAETLQHVFPEKIGIQWEDAETVTMHFFPFMDAIPLVVKQKEIRKKDIAAFGLLKSYEKAPYTEFKLILRGDKS